MQLLLIHTVLSLPLLIPAAANQPLGDGQLSIESSIITKEPIATKNQVPISPINQVPIVTSNQLPLKTGTQLPISTVPVSTSDSSLVDTAADSVSHTFTGIVNQTSDIGKGAFHAVTNPVDSTRNLFTAAVHPIRTADLFIDNLRKPCVGDRAECFGRTVVNVGTFVGGGALGALGPVGQTALATTELSSVNNMSNIGKHITAPGDTGSRTIENGLDSFGNTVTSYADLLNSKVTSGPLARLQNGRAVSVEDPNSVLVSNRVIASDGNLQRASNVNVASKIQEIDQENKLRIVPVNATPAGNLVEPPSVQQKATTQQPSPIPVSTAAPAVAAGAAPLIFKRETAQRFKHSLDTDQNRFKANIFNHAALRFRRNVGRVV